MGLPWEGSLRSLLGQVFFLGVLNSINNLLVAGAHAVVSMQPVPYLFSCQLRIVCYKVSGHHEKSRGAVPALHSKMLPERLLLNTEFTVRPFKPFNRSDGGTVCLHCKHLA